MDGGALHTDSLTFECFRRKFFDRALFGNKFGGCLIIFVGESDFFLALLCNGHGGNNGIVFASQQCRNDPVPVLGHQFALSTHGVTQRHGDVNVKALQFAVGRCITERRVSPFHADTHLFPVFGLDGSGRKYQCNHNK